MRETKTNTGSTTCATQTLSETETFRSSAVPYQHGISFVFSNLYSAISFFRRIWFLVAAEKCLKKLPIEGMHRGSCS